MSLTSIFTSIAIIIAASRVTGATNNDANLFKRFPLLEARQECENPGWIPACPVGIPCVPPGAICCSDGVTYAIPPQICPGGTEPLTTAPTVLPPATTAPPTLTIQIPTAAASSTITIPPVVVSLQLFTTEFTWYYIYYYYTYFQDISTTALTYTEITTTTIVSVSATDSAAASLSFEILSLTFNFPTPTQTATVFSGFVPASATSTTASEIATFSVSLPGFTGSGGISTSDTGRVRVPWVEGERALRMVVVIVGLVMVWL